MINRLSLFKSGLTLGLAWLLAIMESVYVMTGRTIWRDATKFWGTLFGINFAMGVATGVTMEFQFGTNWSYYSHYVGDSFDNALAEMINGLYKTEVIWPRGPWRSFEQVELATLEWVDWFNNRRLLGPIGNIPPAEAEERYHALATGPAMAA